MNITETLRVKAHNDSVARGRAITEVLRTHVGPDLRDTIIDDWTGTEFNLTGKPVSREICDSLIKCKIKLWRHGTFVNTATQRVVLDDVSVEEAAPCDWSTRAGGADQTYTITVTINGFPDTPEDFIARVKASNSFTNPGDPVRWHDVLGKSIRGTPKGKNGHAVVTEPVAVAKTMFVGEVCYPDEHKEELAFKIDDYTWTYVGDKAISSRDAGIKWRPFINRDNTGAWLHGEDAKGLRVAAYLGGPDNPDIYTAAKHILETGDTLGFPIRERVDAVDADA